jgi:hypothetical protein
LHRCCGVSAVGCGTARRRRTGRKSARDGKTARDRQPGRLTGRRLLTGHPLLASLLRAVTIGWRLGWQPAELVRHVGRMADDRHAGMAANVIAAELHRYATATIDEQWTAQLTGLGAELRRGDDNYLQQWRDRAGTGTAAVVACALEVLCVLSALPELARLCPLPGTARCGALAADRPHPNPVDQRMLGRVRALLAKAESTEFAAEAEALTARAQELTARHSIDYALLAAASGSTDAPSGRRLFIENPHEAPKAVLLDVVAAANRSRAVWDRSLGLCTVLGFPADLDGGGVAVHLPAGASDHRHDAGGFAPRCPRPVPDPVVPAVVPDLVRATDRGTARRLCRSGAAAGSGRITRSGSGARACCPRQCRRAGSG